MGLLLEAFQDFFFNNSPNWNKFFSHALSLANFSGIKPHKIFSAPSLPPDVSWVSWLARVAKCFGRTSVCVSGCFLLVDLVWKCLVFFCYLVLERISVARIVSYLICKDPCRCRRRFWREISWRAIVQWWISLWIFRFGWELLGVHCCLWTCWWRMCGHKWPGGAQRSLKNAIWMHP